MVLKSEKITNPKKFSLMLSGSLNRLEISLGIFTSNRYTMQLLKQSNTHVSNAHASNVAEFPNMHSIETGLWKASRMSNKEIIYFYFPRWIWYCSTTLTYNTGQAWSFLLFCITYEINKSIKNLLQRHTVQGIIIIITIFIPAIIH